MIVIGFQFANILDRFWNDFTTLDRARIIFPMSPRTSHRQKHRASPMQMFRSLPLNYLVGIGDSGRSRSSAFAGFMAFLAAALERKTKRPAAPRNEQRWTDSLESELNSHAAICRGLGL